MAVQKEGSCLQNTRNNNGPTLIRIVTANQKNWFSNSTVGKFLLLNTKAYTLEREPLAVFDYCCEVDASEQHLWIFPLFCWLASLQPITIHCFSGCCQYWIFWINTGNQVLTTMVKYFLFFLFCRQRATAVGGFDIRIVFILWSSVILLEESICHPLLCF